MTEYTSRVTIAVPEALIPDANHLACMLGESTADIETFSKARYQDDAGVRYAVCSTVVKPVFLQSAIGTLPAMPVHAVDLVDAARAQAALDTLNHPGGILMIEGDDPQAALTQMGLEPMSVEA